MSRLPDVSDIGMFCCARQLEVTKSGVEVRLCLETSDNPMTLILMLCCAFDRSFISRKIRSALELQLVESSLPESNLTLCPLCQVGIHVVELEATTKKAGNTMEFKFVSSQTFNLYGNASGLTEKETKRWCSWVAKRPMGRVVAVCITDTAMAKTRPLAEEVYGALYELGAPKSLRLIGYREPFAFIGWKGLKQGKGAVGQDPKKQSKTLVRIETTVRKGTSNRDGTGLEFQEVKQDEVKLLGALSAAKKKQSQKKRAALPSPPLSPKKKKSG